MARLQSAIAGSFLNFRVHCPNAASPQLLLASASKISSGKGEDDTGLLALVPIRAQKPNKSFHKTQTRVFLLLMLLAVVGGGGV
jgi:hypothetical protein